MAKHIRNPTVIQATGNKPKMIKEFIGRVNSGTSEVSIAQMESPAGWVEPGQTPEFQEYSLVLKGVLHVKTKSQEFDVKEGESFIAEAHEWVQYSTPHKDGARYIAICTPAFSPNSVHRDA